MHSTRQAQESIGSFNVVLTREGSGEAVVLRSAPHADAATIAFHLERKRLIQDRVGGELLLMRYMLDRVIPAGESCYLDSVDARNLPFYARLGFRVVEAGMVPGSQLRAWALRRG